MDYSLEDVDVEFIIIGLVTAFNLLVIKAKFARKRYEDGILDLVLMLAVVVVFSGSYGGMVVAMIASLAISLYLFASPPTFTKNFKKSPALSEAKQRFQTELKERLKRDDLC